MVGPMCPCGRHDVAREGDECDLCLKIRADAWDFEAEVQARSDAENGDSSDVEQD